MLQNNHDVFFKGKKGRSAEGTTLRGLGMIFLEHPLRQRDFVLNFRCVSKIQKLRITD